MKNKSNREQEEKERRERNIYLFIVHSYLHTTVKLLICDRNNVATTTKILTVLHFIKTSTLVSGLVTPTPRMTGA